MSRRVLIAMIVAVIAGGIFSWSTSVDALEISVHGESQLELSVGAAGTLLYVEGTLRDDLGANLPQMEINIIVEEQGEARFEEGRHTDYFGRFAMPIELPPGTYDVRAEFEGTSHVAGTAASQRVTTDTAPTELRLRAPSWVHGDDTEVPIWLEARSGERGLPTFASVMVNGEGVASVDLDARGRASLDVGPYLELGANEVSAEIAATEHRDGATQVVPLQKVSQPDVNGRLHRIFFRMVRGLEIELTVEAGGETLPDIDAEIYLERNTESVEGGDEDLIRLVKSVHSDRDGRATVLIDDDELGYHEWNVSASIAPPAGPVIWWDGGVVQHEPSRWQGLIRILVLMALIAALLWIGRRGVLALWDALQQRFDTDEEEVSDSMEDILEAVESVTIEAVAPPVESEAREGTGLRLQLWDEWDEQPVADASLTLNGPGGETHELCASTQGIVELPSLPAGSWILRAEAPGFVPAEGEVEIPSELSWARILMTAVPLKIRRAYRSMIKRAHGEDSWGRLTPRQIEAALRTVESAGDENAISPEFGEPRRWRTMLDDWEDCDEGERVDVLLRMITAVVEETNYSGRRFDREIWEATREAMEQLIDGLQVRPGGNDEE